VALFNPKASDRLDRPCPMKFSSSDLKIDAIWTAREIEDLIIHWRANPVALKDVIVHLCNRKEE
jgi:hypothetical protein